MGILLGSSPEVSTWCKLRCAWIMNTESPGVDGYSFRQYSITYFSGVSGLKSAAAGSGLIRWHRGTESSGYEHQPWIVNQYSPGSPPAFPGRNQLAGIGRRRATVDVKDELTGEAVTLTNGSTTLAETQFTVGVTAYADGTTDKGTLTAIGKLETF